MHAMAEATATHGHDEPVITGYMEAYPGSNNLSKTDIATVMFGMLLPLLTQIGHVHSHGS